jgi:hypothetical protein
MNLSTCSGLGAHQAKFFFELPLPQVNVDLAIVKNHIIPSVPDYPAGSDSNFSEYSIVEISSCL